VFNILSLERTAPMGATNPEGRITRRGFLEYGSAALASAGLVGNGYADPEHKMLFESNLASQQL
jgi:hypothetical protein